MTTADLQAKARAAAHRLLVAQGYSGNSYAALAMQELEDAITAALVAFARDAERDERARCLAWCRRFRQFPPGALPDIEAGIVSGDEARAAEGAATKEPRP